MSRQAGSATAWLGQAVGTRATVAAGCALALGAGAALTLVAQPLLVLAVAAGLTVLAAAAAVLWRAAARRFPHTGAGWGDCPACRTRAGSEAALTKILTGDRGTAASLAVVGLVRFSCPQGLRRALQCELLAALGAARAAGAVAGARLYVLPGDRVALLSARPPEDLRPDLEVMVDRANRTLRGASVTVGLVACGRAGLSQAFERAEAAMQRSAGGGTGAVAIAAPPPRNGPPTGAAAALAPVTGPGADAVRELLSGKGEIAVAYQPVVELASGEVLGYEALMRPRSGKLDSPALAFELAGRVGLVAALDRACREAVLSDAPGLDMRRGQLLFVNIAPGSFVHPGLHPHELVEAVQDAGLSPQQVVLEVHEGQGVEAADLAAQAARLRSSGFRVALDDVGSGQSRLETLWRCPLDYLKLDQQLTQQAAREPAAQAVFQSLCALATQLRATLVVEGVENERLLRFVRTVGGRQLDPLAVHAVQGYELGRPGPRPKLPAEAAPGAAQGLAGEPAASAGPG